MRTGPLITLTSKGLYCPLVDLYLDPWSPVKNAIVTHGHADHARPGMGLYITHSDCEAILRHRLGSQLSIKSLKYGEQFIKNGVSISLHPAGHVLGSSQIRVEYKGEVWVLSGDYKDQHDPSCQAFEPIRCDTFITESTFGLPVFNWPSPDQVIQNIGHWWQRNQQDGKTSILVSYSLGKAQRILSQLPVVGAIYCHGAIQRMNDVYRQLGIKLPETHLVSDQFGKNDYLGNLVMAPPSAFGSPWLKRFSRIELGLTSGWMALRGTRRRRNVDRGFVLSDHVDWRGLNQAVKATQASRVMVTHGYSEIFASWLQTQGLDASIVRTRFEGELGEIGESEDSNLDQT